MQVITDTSAPKDFSTVTRDIMLRNDKTDAPVDSAVLSKEAALRANKRSTIIYAGTIIAVSLAFLAPMSWLSFADNQPIMGWSFLGGLVFLVAASLGMAPWSVKYFSRTIGGRLRPMPAAGTTLRFDETNLAVGGRTLPLSSLQLDLVHLRSSIRGKTRGVYEVERLTMTTPNGPLVLDQIGITNGQALVDNVYRCIGPAGFKIG